MTDSKLWAQLKPLKFRLCLCMQKSFEILKLIKENKEWEHLSAACMDLETCVTASSEIVNKNSLVEDLDD